MATYVISDIHSHGDNLDRFLRDTGPEDKIYCLGDTIDKGKNGIQVLVRMMEDDKITFIMGNHELMMYLFLEAEKMINSRSLNLRVLNYYYNKRDHWQYYNYGLDTYNDYMRLPEEKREEIYRFLQTMPVQLNVEVNGRKFLLVHSKPYGDYDKDVFFNEVEEDIDHYVWDRAKYCHVEGKIVITGHNVVSRIDTTGRIIETDGQWYDIDCGLAANDANSRLAALKLDDLSVKYY